MKFDITGSSFLMNFDPGYIKQDQGLFLEGWVSGFWDSEEEYVDI